MFSIKQPKKIIFGEGSAHKFDYPKNCLIVTSKGARSRAWFDYLDLKNSYIFEEVEPNPSIETAEKTISEFRDTNFSHVIGLGGGSSLDIAKFVAFKMKRSKILIPTTFGSGSEVTCISVLKVDNKKTSFHDDNLLADIAIIDPYFMKDTPVSIKKNSAVDALAQCSEGYDSKIGNMHTKFLCRKGFDLLEDGVVNENPEKIVLGSLFAGLGFGNCSTTLGHALSYVFSNEGIPHGHALAFTTTVAHRFNNSIFYDRFFRIVSRLKFSNIYLKQSLEEAAELILTDRKHLDNNPNEITKKDVIFLLEVINSGRALEQF